MKKILFILMVCISIVACNKHEIEDVEIVPMVTISFDQQLVSGNSMVRSTTNEFLDIIEEQTPDYVNVTLKNTDLNKTYTCKSNETITIPIGNYEIHASIDGQAFSSSSGGTYYGSACLKVDKFTKFINGQSQKITLNTYYNCYAIFALIDECKSCSFSLKYNKYYIAYFKNSTNVTLTPYEDSTEFITTTYTFSTTYTVGKVFAEYGKYYVIHPQKVDKTSTSFEMNLENMTEGEI